MTAINIDLLLKQKIELFANLPQKNLDYIVSRSSTLKLSKGDLLFTAGEKAGHFYILINGAIRIFKKNNTGSEDETARFTQGDTIGDFDFARGAEYDAIAEADEDSELIQFPGYDYTMDILTHEEPDIVCTILLNGIGMMTERIISTHKLILDKMSWAKDLHRRAYEDMKTGLWKQTLITDEILDSLKKPAALIMLKPDRFKILVDSHGHSAGDEAMSRIALILKNIVRFMENDTGDAGWALRFKSNEIGLILNNCSAEHAKEIAWDLAEVISGMEPVPAGNDIPEFNFSVTISWCIWHKDGTDWESLFEGNYFSLLENWRNTGDIIIHYLHPDNK